MVDYSLARKSLLLAVRQGGLSTTEVCDAHPELLRAGKHIGHDPHERCPVCSHDTLRLVRYVYGDQLKRDNGKVVYPAEWLRDLIDRYDQFTCYVVEVCIDCAWNHLLRSFVTGRKFAADEQMTKTEQQG
jgi:hypothetical protein